MGRAGQTTTQYSLMKSGEHYLLFLSEENPRRIQTLPSRPGLMRFGFAAGGQPLSSIRIEGNRLFFNRELPEEFKTQNSRKSASEIIENIQAHIRLENVNVGK